MAHDIFICHSSEDRAVANAVVAGLEQAGITCWVAPRDVMPGADYAEAIVAGISGAQVLVLVFSQHSNTSPHVSREVERAVSRGIDIIPFRIENVEPSRSLEYFISSAQWFDATSGTTEEHVGELARLIRLRFEGEAGEGPRQVTKEVLRDLLDRYGPELTEDPRRLQALLRDVAGEHRAEVAALLAGAEEGVGPALLQSSQGLTPELVERLVRRLQQNRALAEDASRWAVNAWVYALGMEKPAREEMPDPSASGLPETVAATTPDPPAQPSEPPPASPPQPPPPPPATVAAPVAGAPTPQRPAMPPPAIRSDAPASQAVRPASGAGDVKGRRWKIWAGVGAAVVALGVIGAVIGDDADSRGPSATTIATATTIPTTTTIRATPTTGVTTTGVSASAGTGLSSNPYRVPLVESFGSAVDVFESAERTTELGTRAWDIEGGQLAVETEAASGKFPLFSISAWFILPTSYAISVDIAQPSGDGVRCGIHLRGGPDSVDRFFFLLDSFSQQYRVVKVNGDGGLVENLIGSTFDSTIRTSEVNRIELFVAGEELAFTVNGETVAELSETALPEQTRIGPAVSVSQGAVERCTFDNLSILEHDGSAPTASSGTGTLALAPSALGPGWEISDRDESQTGDNVFPIHCGGTEASGTVRIDSIESQSYIHEDDRRRAFVLVAESEPDLIDALFASERANLAFCDAGGGFLRPVASATPPDLGSDALAGRSLLGSTDDTQFTMIKVSATTALYTLLYDPANEMGSFEGSDFAEVVYNAMFS
ncbi:MAG: toll/interleukin-1 receptor domain-containing protein [bacterium]|nr:toll/interleukin-1 receptor domain-containing protein [bacterium]